MAAGDEQNNGRRESDGRETIDPHAKVNVGPILEKTSESGSVQFIDHLLCRVLYSRPMDVYPLEGHA